MLKTIGLQDSLRFHKIVTGKNINLNSWYEVINLEDTSQIILITLLERRTKLTITLYAHELSEIKDLEVEESERGRRINIYKPDNIFIDTILPHIEFAKKLSKLENKYRCAFEMQFIELRPVTKSAKALKMLLGARHSNCLACEGQVYKNDVPCLNIHCIVGGCRHCHRCGATLCGEGTNPGWQDIQQEVLEIMQSYINSVKEIYPKYFQF